MKRIYWSTISLYGECPQKYLWMRGHKGIDLGGGPGRSKPLPIMKSEHDALMGSVLSKAIEHLYNDELYKSPSTLIQRLEDLTERAFKLELGERYVDWKKSPPKDVLLKTCVDGAIGYLRTMKANKLLGTYSRSEVDLSAVSKPGDLFQISGRPDLIIEREDNGVTILDGKNAKTPGKYTDPDQLKWYAFCYYLVNNKLPDRLAFCYFRYPYNSPPEGFKGDSWSGLVSVDFSQDDFEALDRRARETILGIGSGKFDPTPSPSVCRLCEYETVCEARQAQKSSRSRRKKEKPSILSGSTGFQVLEG